MPQKFRQRGKKKKAGDKGPPAQNHYGDTERVGDQPGPSSHGKSRREGASLSSGAPFQSPSAGDERGFEGTSNLIPLGGGLEQHDSEIYDHQGAGRSRNEETLPMHIPVDLGGQLESDAHADVAPFGFVPPELKAYLKDAYTNLLQLDLEKKRGKNKVGEEDLEEDDEEGQAGLLRQAMLREINGQELTVATDGECSVALETIIDGLDGRRLRILADRLSGSCATLAAHRFGSHILQAILQGLQRDLVCGTALKGKARQFTQEQHAGVLRSSEQLILDFTAELEPHSQTLLQDTFGTHVVRTMLLLLSGADVSATSRSKKSAAFRSKTHAAAVAEGDEQDAVAGKLPADSTKSPVKVPASFSAALRSFRQACVPMDQTGRNEARALLVSSSASPTFALLLSLEASAGESTKAGSLADIVLEGLISASVNDESPAESIDAVETLLRHPSGSHCLEAIISRLPTKVVDRFWNIYVKGKVTRLACHPVGNFVQASATRRLSRSVVQAALEEIKDKEGGKMVKEHKTGVLLALLERAAALSTDEDSVLEELALDAVLATFGFEDRAKNDEVEATLALKAILALKTRDGWEKMMRRRDARTAKNAAAAAAAASTNEDEDEEGERIRKKRKRGEEEAEDQTGKLRMEEVTIQGSVLLQALVRLREPHNEIIYKGLLTLPTPQAYASNPISSHIYLLALSSPTSSYLQRRKLILSLLAHIPTLADDKYASRVSDAIWDRSDGFIKEKIVREVILGKDSRKKQSQTTDANVQSGEGDPIPSKSGEGEGKSMPTEQFLSGSFYGRFFLRRVGLAMYRKDVWRWKDWIKNSPGLEFASRLGVEESKVEHVVVGEGERDGSGEVEERRGRRNQKEKKMKRGKTVHEKELDDILAAV